MYNVAKSLQDEKIKMGKRFDTPMDRFVSTLLQW